MKVQDVLGYIDAGLGLVSTVLGWVPLAVATRTTVGIIIDTARAGLHEAIERDTVLTGAADGVKGSVSDER